MSIVYYSALRMQDVEKVRLNHPDKIPVSCLLDAVVFHLSDCVPLTECDKYSTVAVFRIFITICSCYHCFDYVGLVPGEA